MAGIENFIMNALTFLFSKHRYLILTSFNQADYYNTVTKLKNHGVSYRTRITSHDTGMAGASRNDLNLFFLGYTSLFLQFNSRRTIV